MADYLDRKHEELYCGQIRNCIVGHGVLVHQLDNGEVVIFVDPEPIDVTNDSDSLRKFMKETAESWLNQLAMIPFKSVVNDNEANT